MRGRVGEEKVVGIPAIHREGMGGEGLLAQEHAQGAERSGDIEAGGGGARQLLLGISVGVGGE
jgi:hypothetical protein